jgi:hypothetical protein
MLCPEQARLVGLNLLPEQETDAAEAGTAVHAAIEMRVNDPHATFGDALDRAIETFDIAESSPTFVWTKYSRRTADRWIETCLGHWWETYGDKDFSLCQAETYFQVPIVDTPTQLIELGGTIDLDTPTSVEDWKTSGRGEYEQREYQRWDIQSTMYLYARYFNVMHKQGLQRFKVERDQNDFAWLRDQAATAAVLIEAELPVWPKRDDHWLCSAKWCPAWSQCKGKHFSVA